MRSSLLSAILFNALAHSSPLHKRANASDPWFLERFSSLVAFGDSYTDENRLGYFATHNGSAPPVGTVLPEVTNAPYHVFADAGLTDLRPSMHQAVGGLGHAMWSNIQATK